MIESQPFLLKLSLFDVKNCLMLLRLKNTHSFFFPKEKTLFFSLIFFMNNWRLGKLKKIFVSGGTEVVNIFGNQNLQNSKCFLLQLFKHNLDTERQKAEQKQKSSIAMG